MQLKKEHSILIITTVLASFVLLTGDSLIYSLVYQKGPFFQVFIARMQQDMFHRLFIALTLPVSAIVIYIMLSRHRRSEDAMKRLTAAMETSMDGVAIYDRRGHYLYVNQAYASINGYESPAELIGRHMKSAYEDQEYARIEQVCMPLLQKNKVWRGELLAKRRNGSTYIQEASVTLLEDGGRVCISHDITWRKRSEERVRRSERFLNNIFNSIRDPFCIFDSEMRIIRANQAYAGMKGKNVGELIGRKCHDIFSGRNEPCSQCVVEKSFQSADPCAKEKEIRSGIGQPVWVDIYTYPILDENGRVSHVIEYTRDMTARKQSEQEKSQLIQKLEHLSRTDGLTGLANRRALTDSLIYEFDRAGRFKTELTLILCDIDNFKQINDRYGHAAGDRALEDLSTVFMGLLRKTDIVGRYGGDEFMLILPGTSLAGAESLADKLLAVVRTTDIPLGDGRSVRLSLSIGISELQPQDQDIEALIKRADEAMYAAKLSGRDRALSNNVKAGE